MIIICINCNKKFNVNSQLIPDNGRTIQCGSCNHTWFYNKNDGFITNKSVDVVDKKKPIEQLTKSEKKDISFNKKNIKTNINKNSELVKYQTKTSFSFSNFLSYLLVAIISFTALIVVLDTFKIPLYIFFPKLEFLLFNFFETLKDIKLFIRDLI